MVSPPPVLCLLCLTLAAADPAGAAEVRVPRTPRPPRLEDFIAARPRPAEVRIDDFRQFSPGDGAPASQPTTAYLSYDGSNLYVVFVCKDDPRLIRARMAKREQIMQDDRITISLDTFHDHRRAYWFDVNPFGVQADGNVTDFIEDDTSWDTLWHSEARITRDGYVALARIPFRSLRFPNTGRQSWGIVLGRYIQRNNECACWPHVSPSRPGWVRQGGDLTGIQDISPGRNLQFIPYALFSHARFLDLPPAAAPRFQTRTEARAGLDAKMVLRDSFTVDVALNPDFSQVESDEPQVTINQRYEVFFPEKRPFFIENAGLFKTPEQLFFSRRIVDPRLGARFSGKLGRWALGALAIDDRAPGETADPGGPLRGRHAVAGVFRVQREFLRDSSIGALVTSRDFGDSFNRVYALDSSLKIRRNWVFTGQAMRSETRYLNNRRDGGPAWFAELAHLGRHLNSRTSYTDRSPRFFTELGYIARVDMRQLDEQLDYRWRPETGPVIAFGPRLHALVNRSRAGQTQDWTLSPEFVIEFRRNTELAVERHEIYELFAGRGFRKGHSSVELETEWLKWLSASASYVRGSNINFYPAAGLDPFLANSVNTELSLTLRPGSRARLQETYIHSSLAAGGRRLAPGREEAASIFDNHILRSKANYQFNRELSLRAILDYNAVLANPSLVRLERTRHFGVDLLLSYVVNPGTALHLGYTDLYDNLAFDPNLHPALRRTASPGLSTGRQFFVKLSYLLRM
ncbi:MAG: carbohydrate binding family 9 domain-containing protein [Bryobacterales bacterium]|nr:carbohydrate binding family 9 domain-containing protein [Bryobacterales bacterium]